MRENTIYTGLGKAVRAYPEWWGKKTLEAYDRIRFPENTKEEKKIRDRLHNFLKKYYKAVGWVETGVQTAIITGIVVKGYKKFRGNASGLQAYEMQSKSADIIPEGDQTPVAELIPHPSRVVDLLPVRPHSSYFTGTLVERDAYIHPWEGGEKGILEHIHGMHQRSGNRRTEPVQKYAAEALALAAQAFDAEGIGKNALNVKATAGKIGGFVTSHYMAGFPLVGVAMMRKPSPGDERSKLALYDLELAMKMYIKSFGFPRVDIVETAPRKIFDYWADKLLFAASHLLVPHEPQIVGLMYDPLNGTDPKASVCMRNLVNAYRIFGWMPDNS